MDNISSVKHGFFYHLFHRSHADSKTHPKQETILDRVSKLGSNALCLLKESLDLILVSGSLLISFTAVILASTVSLLFLLVLPFTILAIGCVVWKHVSIHSKKQDLVNKIEAYQKTKDDLEHHEEELKNIGKDIENTGKAAEFLIHLEEFLKHSQKAHTYYHKHHDLTKQSIKSSERIIDYAKKQIEEVKEWVEKKPKKDDEDTQTETVLQSIVKDKHEEVKKKIAEYRSLIHKDARRFHNYVEACKKQLAVL